MRVAVVMPPVTELDPHVAVESWHTVTAAADALSGGGRVEPVVHCRHASLAVTVRRADVEYRFHRTDADLATAVGADRPDVMHVHGLGWSRLVRRLHQAARAVPIVLQHHGELPFTGRARIGHRAVRRYVSAYLFTGASTGQARPWIDAGVIDRRALLCEVLEAGPLLPDEPVEPVALPGAPVVLWVGRLMEGKDPLTAVDAFALAAGVLPDAHLHMLTTDRTMEPAVRARIAVLGHVGERIHLHGSVPHAAMRGWYEAAQVFLTTSRHEAAGYSLIEALTCGCAPAVSAIAPHRAVVQGMGVEFPPGDAVAASRALVTCASTSREPIAERARTILSWGTVAEQLADAYLEAMQRTGDRA